jgi:hypothetical protein
MEQRELDIDNAAFGDPPESVQENVREMSSIMRQRRAANARIAEERDTERFLVIVYPNRAAREAQLARLGLPTDERYLLGGAVEIAVKDGKRIVDALIATSRDCKAADVAHSGEAG